ncbi:MULTISPECIES: asparaginase domain-containing protein [unclassified Beijerinckia]|uniref:asparaginase domain-containing protein n=1 Tax=unclassified Beijerinckia TaxID=2638183 RepID=UPI000898FEE4|nr:MULTISPECIES: asparaginase domain-containing protein [unclassified Beijerinckia]MDH7797578.1 L-asparaginase [Beijerinckia sp. GAS462]SEC91140.1 L-asparaginase/Glu-tRNAGln amidotransferase subunit D [Beijerinckia sp. 28-YEA-48]
MTKARIAHLAGPTATIQNTPPLVTSNKARAKYGLPLLPNPDGSTMKYDALRAQRLAAPVKIYVEQYSAHPLEIDVAELYGPPDGYMGPDGVFKTTKSSDSDKPVYEIELKPEDGLYPLPYMARQVDGSPWEEECVSPGAQQGRQGFFPDGSRSFEEIDRLSIGTEGVASQLSSIAEIDFYRGAPPGGFTKGKPAHLRADRGEGDIAPERRGHNFFGYKPYHLATAPPRPMLAKVTNDMQALVDSADYDGVIWTQGSPQVEESAYWFNLLIDTTKPICGNAAQRPQGQISNDGPKNIVDSASYIQSRIWADDQGRDRCGVVVIQEQQIFAAREVAKVDARPGGYVATGGHGGIIGQVSHTGRLALTYLPVFKHTYMSDVRLSQLPHSVSAVKRGAHGLESVMVAVKDTAGQLLASAIPLVSIIKDGSYSTLEFGDDPALEADLIASIEHKLSLGMLTGLVIEGLVPYGSLPSTARHKLMLKAAFSGIPVAKVGRNAPEGFADPHDFQIAATNLTATKARLLLMACLLKFGSLPAAQDPDKPTSAELDAICKAVARYQDVFTTH